MNLWLFLLTFQYYYSLKITRPCNIQ